MNSCKAISKTDASIYLQFWNYSANLRLKVQYHFLLVSDCHYFATPAGNKTSCEKCSESLLHRKWQKGRNVVKSNFLFTFSDRLYKQTCGRRGKPLQSAGRCTHPTAVPGKNQFFLASLLYSLWTKLDSTLWQGAASLHTNYRDRLSSRGY